ncbi:MAG: cysteine--tRNA ligase [Deltaproteobacteria bacterium]|nr:MAG: cysteine--tRNA ligase [Deltaproteobacteria bacterium]
MALKIFNTLGGQKETFEPLTPGRVHMYVCGVTVYDSAHLGHCRFLITFDVIYRYLRFLGFDVNYVRNFTDVDDKIIKRANEENASCEAITERYIGEFHQDSGALGLLAPTIEPRATAHIAEIVEMIKRLEAQGLAYRVDGDVFFSVAGFGDYGKLSRKNIDELEAGARVEVDERKRSPLDFALWKSSKPGEPTWESPWGHGRPGWHIECSAMSTKYLGQPFDIHGGGRDLIFPHHENEIAQSEGAYGRPLARFWLHNGFLNINQEKMSKSLGNFFTIREILDDFDPAALRHYFLSSHYRSPMDFSKDGLNEAARATDRIIETLDRVNYWAGYGAPVVADPAVIESFRAEMDDDFNTPRALALIFDEVRSLNRLLDGKKSKGIEERGAALGAICDTLGLLRDGYADRKKQRFLKKTNITIEQIKEFIDLRDQARAAKNWQEADRIRDQLAANGIVLEDTVQGTMWKVK